MSTEPAEALINEAPTATQSDPEIGNGNGTGNAGDAAREHTNAHAGPRAHARGPAEPAVPDEPVATETLGNRLAGHAVRLAEVFQPPEIWDTDRPSLAKVAARAKRGGWTKTDGTVRRAGIAYFRLVYVPTAAACRYLDWIVERPSRLAVALAVLGLIVGAIWSYL